MDLKLTLIPVSENSEAIEQFDTEIISHPHPCFVKDDSHGILLLFLDFVSRHLNTDSLENVERLPSPNQGTGNLRMPM